MKKICWLWPLLFMLPLWGQTPCPTPGKLESQAKIGDPVTVCWDYSTNLNGKILHFRARKGQTPGGFYEVMNDAIPATDRSLVFQLQAPTNLFLSVVYQTFGTPLQAIDAGNVAGPALPGYVVDQGFAGGVVASTTTAIDVTYPPNPAAVGVYQKARTGSFTYTLTGLSNSTAYLVRLHFAEITKIAAGQRKFDVSVNGTKVIVDYDIFATAGAANKAVIQQLTRTTTIDGKFLITFSNGSIDVPLVSAIEVYDLATSQQKETAGSNHVVINVQTP